jgi:type IV pilus assembly protein PilO
MNFQEILDSAKNLNGDNIGTAHIVIKAFIYILVLLAVLFLGHRFQLADELLKLEKIENKELDLKKNFEAKAFKAANLERYKQQLAEMEESYGALLRQLPSDTEVPGLLEDITHTGLGSGLDFKSIALGSEMPSEFYTELPLTISINGGYHSFANFVSGVSALPRIVTLHDFTVVPKGSGGELDVNVKAKTYRYNEKGGEG